MAEQRRQNDDPVSRPTPGHGGYADALGYAEAIIATVREPLVVLEGDLRVRTASRSFYRTFRVRPEETEGRLLYDLGNRQWDIPALRKLLCEILPQKMALEDFEVEHDFEHIGRKVMLLNARKLHRDGDRTELILLAIEDVTERRRAERAADDARSYAEGIVGTVREPLVVLDGDLRVRTANRSFYAAFRVRPEDTERRLLYDLGDRQWDIPALWTLLEDILPQNTTFNDFEVEHDFEHIGRKVMLLNARKLYREGNHTELILLAIEDVTALREEQRARREAEARFTEMVKNVRDHSIFLTDPEGVITSWNVAAERIIGYAEAEAVGRHYSLIFTPEDIQAGIHEQELRQARDEGRAEDERWHVRKDGTLFWALGIVTPLHDPQGRLSGFSKILRDMTDWKRADEASRERERQLQLVTDTAPILIAHVGADLRYKFVNRPYAERFGLHPRDIIGRCVRDVLGAEAFAGIEPHVEAVLSGQRVEFEAEAPYGGSGTQTVRVAYEPERDGGGRVVGYVAAILNITDRKRAERRRTARLAVTQTLSQADSLRAAAPDILRAVCDSLGWSVGVLWAVDRGAATLRCVDVWQHPPESAGGFVTATRQRTFGRGKSLPGRVWAGRSPLWVADVTQDAHFLRRHQATEGGLHGGFACPVSLEGKVLGVIEFFSRDIREPDADLLEMMTTLGGQIGQFMERRRAEEQLAASRGRLQALFDNTLDAILLADDHARYVDANPAACKLLGYGRDELLRRSVFDITPAPNGEAGRAAWAAFVRDGHQAGEYALSRHDGTTAVAEYRAVANVQPGLHLSVLRDVTERRRTEDALRESERQYRRLFENMAEEVHYWRLVHDERGGILTWRLVDANPPALRTWGKTLDAIRGKTTDEIFGPGSTEHYRAVVERVMAEGVPHSFEDYFPQLGRHFRFTSVPVDDHFITTGADITAVKQANEALRENEARLRAISDNLPQGAVYQVLGDREGRRRFLYISAGVERLFGVTPAEAVADAGSLYGLVHEEDRDRVAAAEQVALRDGTPFDCEFRSRTRSGGVIWVHARSAPRPLPTGQVVWEGILVDVTARKAAERESEVYRGRLDLVVNSVDVGLWYCDLPFDRLVWNAKVKEHFGLPADADVTIGTFYERLHPDDRERTRQAIERSIRDRTGYDIEYRTVGLDGRERWVRAIGRAFYGPSGEPVSFDGITVDVTERVRQEQALKDADRRKDEFLATLAHELRNPLAPLRNALQVMKLAAGDAEAVEQARGMMDRQLGQMVRLVDDLLDVSRITRGKLQLRRERVDLASVVRAAVETARPLIEASAHRLTVTLPPEAVVLDADPVRLAQVFSNLLTNAAKYTERGGIISLTAKRDGGEVFVAVRDTGIGIAAEHLPRLFEMFSQVASALERSQGGLGIGLSLVKGLVEMHGGSVEARSEGLGRGSEFVIRLPVTDGPTASLTRHPVSGEQEAARPRLRILVADDNRDAAGSLAVMLRLGGHEVHAVHDGQEAVEAAGWFRPDLALLDIGMPRLNGYEACRRIREQPWGRNVVLVAITGWGQDEDKRRATDAGFDHHMTKPVDPAALEKLLAGAPGRKGARP